jgi:MFS family permease
MSFRSASRDVAVVAAGRAVSMVGDEVALVALLLWASDQGHGAGVVAALVVAAALPQLLVAPLAGLAADRLPLRRLVAGTAVAQSLLCLLIAAVLPSAAVAVVVALVAVRAAGQTFLSPAWQAWVPTLVPSERLSAALSTVQTATAGAALVGPALGGILVGAAGVQWALVVDAVSFLGIAVAALLVSRQPERAAVAGGAKEKGQLTAGLRIVAADPVLRGFLVVIATMVVALGALNVAEVFLITDVLGAGPAAYGAVASLFALGLMGGAAFGRRNRTDSRVARLLVASTVLMSASAVVLGLAPGIAVAAAASFCVGVGNGLLNVLGQTLTVRRTPRELLGRVFAVVQAVAGAGALIATAVGGLLLALLEVRSVVVLCGAVTVVSVLVVGRSLVRAADRPRTVEPEPEPVSA